MIYLYQLYLSTHLYQVKLYIKFWENLERKSTVGRLVSNSERKFIKLSKEFLLNYISLIKFFSGYKSDSNFTNQGEHERISEFNKVSKYNIWFKFIRKLK
jgi:hypothetical protein